MSNYTECPSCGTEISKTAKKCPFCGVRLKKPFYKKGWFVFLILLCIIGGGGYVGKVYFGLDYLQLAQQGGNWLHNMIVSETPAPTPSKEPAADKTETPNPETEKPAAEPVEEPAETPEKKPAETPKPVETPKPAADQETAADAAEEVVICTAAEITRTYENNVLAGNLEYRGKTCRVSGTIKTFGEVGEQSYVVLNGWNSGSLVGVRCFVDSLDDVETLAGMKKGQKITLEGICVGLSVNVDLDEAHIAKGSVAVEKENTVQPEETEKNQENLQENLNEENTSPESTEDGETNNGQTTEARNNTMQRQALR